MKLKNGLKYNEVCGQSFILPMGEDNIDFSKVIALNESSVVLWKRMDQGDFTEDDLVKALLDEYEVDEDTARKDVLTIINQFRKENIILDD